MNNVNKIDIIICGNNKLYLDEQKKYIENLIIPDGMQLDILVVEGAKSMTLMMFAPLLDIDLT